MKKTLAILVLFFLILPLGSNAYSDFLPLKFPTRNEVSDFVPMTGAEYLKSLDYNYEFVAGRDYDDQRNYYNDQEYPVYEKYDYDWVIDDFHVVYNLQSDSTLKIDERIWVNFWAEKHGIFRYIPTIYKDDQGLYYDLRLKFDSASDENGLSYNLADRQKSDPFYLKIGDANVYEIGPKLYRIKYVTQRGVRFFDDHDEIYWNVSGSDWEVPILNAKATVILPQEVNRSEVKLVCYLGPVGSSETSDCGVAFLDDKTVEFTANRPYNDGLAEDFTFAVWLPKGIVIEPLLIQKIWWRAIDNWGIFILPIIVCILMYLIWRRIGQDKKIEKAIIAQYEENKDLSPIVAGNLLRDTEMKNDDLSAEIVYLAVRKYLKIKEEVSENKITKYKLIKLKEPDDKLKEFQKYLLKSIFTSEKTTEVSLASLKDRFYVHLTDLRKKSTEYCLKFYDTGMTSFYLAIACGIIFFGLSMMVAIGTRRWDIFIGGIISAVIIIVFGRYLPKKSPLGLETLWYIKGLKQFIEVAEKYRVKFYEDQHLFDQVLPYAMVFNMVNKLEKAFEGIYTQPPTWYESSSPFKLAAFTASLNHFSTRAISTMKSQPAPPPSSYTNSRGGSSSSSGFSGGGGSSGGGFGGGGGGSW